MSFLKAMGMFILRAAGVAQGFAPAVAQVFPASAGIVGRVESELQQLVDVVIMAETVGQSLGVPGADKARVAGPLIAQLFLKSSALAGKVPTDPAAFLAASTRLSGDLADLLNAFAPVQATAPAA